MGILVLVAKVEGIFPISVRKTIYYCQTGVQYTTPSLFLREGRSFSAKTFVPESGGPIHKVILVVKFLIDIENDKV